jgi:hypothetical protein
MNTKVMRFAWLVPVCLIACIGGSLLAVWALSSLMGFGFNPLVVGVLSAAVCGTAIAVSHRRKDA